MTVDPQKEEAIPMEATTLIEIRVKITILDLVALVLKVVAK